MSLKKLQENFKLPNYIITAMKNIDARRAIQIGENGKPHGVDYMPSRSVIANFINKNHTGYGLNSKANAVYVYLVDEIGVAPVTIRKWVEKYHNESWYLLMCREKFYSKMKKRKPKSS